MPLHLKTAEGDLRLITEPSLHMRYAWLSHAIYRVALLHNHVGVSPQPPPVCSIHLDDAAAAIGQRHQCAHHTPATGGEEKESLSQFSGWGLLGGHDWQEPVVAIWPGHRGYTLLFMRSAMEFFYDHRESGPQFNVSSERQCFLTV